MDESDINQNISSYLKTNQSIENARFYQNKYYLVFLDAILVYPFKLLNLRRQANQSLFMIGQENKVNNYFQMFRIIKKGGINSFYRGFIFQLYHQMAQDLLPITALQLQLNFHENKTYELISLSILSITYPLVLVSNLCALGSYKQFTDLDKTSTIFKTLYNQYGGFKGIYRGFSLYIAAYFIKTLPSVFYFQNNNNKDYLYLLTSFLSYPLETLRARLIAIPDQNLSAKNIYSFAKNMYKQESIKSYFVGYPAFLTLNLMLLTFNKRQLLQFQEIQKLVANEIKISQDQIDN